MADAALEDSVRIFAREFLGIRTGDRAGAPLASPSRAMVGTVMTGLLASLFSRSSYFDSPSATEPPAVVIGHDADMIRVVEGSYVAVERGIIGVPLRRSDLPNQLREIVPVFVVDGPAALRGKIGLISPLDLSLRRQWHLAGFLAAGQITNHQDHGLAALRSRAPR